MKVSDNSEKNLMVATSHKKDKERTRIGVIGCGWLGRALVESLVQQKFYVVATTQQKQKIPTIEALGAQAEIVSLPASDMNINSAAVFYCETIVVCIPPQIRSGKKDYPDKIAEIVKHAELGVVKKIILLSTTAIYDGIIGDVTESSSLHLNNEKVSILSEGEQQALAFKGKTVVIRAAGLVGPERHPGIFFRNKKILTAPNSYVNLIHQSDVVGQIISFINNKHANGIFNAVSEMQVTKKHYYSIAAAALNITLPDFDTHSEVELGRKVIGDKVRDYLAYQYQYDDLVTWLLMSENIVEIKEKATA